MQKEIRVVVDTNVFIGAWFDEIKSCMDIIDLIDNGDIIPLFSLDTMGEAFYMIRKFAIEQDPLEKALEKVKLLSEFMFYGESIYTKETETEDCYDSDDTIFVKCAIKGKADYLITNDWRSGMLLRREHGFIPVKSHDFYKLYTLLQENMNEETKKRMFDKLLNNMYKAYDKQWEEYIKNNK